ncbi:MAG TPA: hypothetical protein VM534_01470, partial [Thermoanaerobaculia bacterium]|nr:hypothetical protein [Thermoanaerobaculia bacterium]
MQLDFDATAPIFLVHGTNGGPSTWEHGVVEYLDTLGIPYSNEIQLEKNGSIELNGELLAKRLRELARAFGARKCHLVAHSKGGNDSREYLTKHDPKQSDLKVLSLYTLSTPFHGTVFSDIIWLARTTPGRGSSNPYISELIARDYSFLNTPCCQALRQNQTASMQAYNRLNPFTATLKFYNFAADADLNDDGLISKDERTPLFPDILFGNAILDAAAE